MLTLNSPIELGVRSLVVLSAAFPRALDINRLVLMDYCVLHSADIGGPPSLLPAVPARTSELGVKRQRVEHGLQVMVRAGMIDVLASSEGFLYKASEEAGPFLELLDSTFVASLTEKAAWTVAEFGDLETAMIRERMRDVSEQWIEEFTEGLEDEEGMASE